MTGAAEIAAISDERGDETAEEISETKIYSSGILD